MTLNIFTVTAEIENGTDINTAITDAFSVIPETGTEVVATAAPTSITAEVTTNTSTPASDTMPPDISPMGKETEYNVCLSV